MEGEPVHPDVVAFLEALFDGAVELVGIDPESAVRVHARPDPQQDAHRAGATGEGDHPLQLVEGIHRDQAPVASREPEEIGALGRAGDHEVRTADPTPEGVHQLRGARHVDPRPGVDAGGQPAASLVGLLPVADLALDAGDGQHVGERPDVVGEAAGVQDVEGPSHRVRDVGEQPPVGADVPGPRGFDRRQGYRWLGYRRPGRHRGPFRPGQLHSATRCPRPVSIARVARTWATGMSVITMRC